MIASSSVVFSNGGVPLAGRIYRDSSLDARQPTIIVTGSWLTVQDQMAALYAARLASLGFIAFTFDFSGFGRSGGAPRQLEMPSRKIGDIIAAVDFVRTLSFVDRVGYLGVCASAQYATAAIARGARIDSFASVAGWFHDAASVAGFYGGPEGVARRLDRAARAADRFTTSGDVETVPAYEAGNQDAGMFIELDYYASPARGAIPAWKNEMATMSWSHWLLFDGLTAAKALPVPAAFVHGDGCVFPDHVRMIHASVAGPKALLWLDGFQVDFYDQPHLVDPAIDAVKSHFDRTLRATR
jgi:fermentation-respiration switch protein FrsA (DUF1100 family)